MLAEKVECVKGSSWGKCHPVCQPLALSLAVAMLVGSIRVVVVAPQKRFVGFMATTEAQERRPTATTRNTNSDCASRV